MAGTSTYYIIVYSIFFVVALGFSVVINGLFLRFSKTLGVREKEVIQLRWASVSKPSFGGISFFICFLLAIIAYPYFLNPNLLLYNYSFLGFVWAATLAFLMGLFDDSFNTNVWIKLFSQIACALILIFTGTVIEIFHNEYLNYIITVIWVVGMMNSINMLDNMDAITTVVSVPVILSIIISLISFTGLQNPYLFSLFGLLAALIGFLIYNWHPSKMYMGDTGSQFLGLVLAFLGIVFFWNFHSKTVEITVAQRLISVLLAFALPIIDTTTVFIKRISAGKSPFIGGRDHTTHHLSYIGLKDNQIAFIYAFISFVYAFLSISVLYFIPTWYFMHAIVFSIFFILLFAVLFYIANKNIK